MNFIVNDKLKEQLDEVAEIAGILWQRGWAERNAGNISINITDIVGEENKQAEAIATYNLPKPMPLLIGDFFYVTGTGKQMRNVAKDPLKYGSIVRVTPDGKSYDIVARENIKPTSELASHFSIMSTFKERNSKNRLVLHTHPTELIALTHIAEIKNAKAINEILWGMHPETFIVVPQGIGLVPYEIPGTVEIATLTLPELEKHDILLWEKHGAFAIGENLGDTFDLLDTLNKSAQIYAFVKSCGYEPEGLNQKQLDDLIIPFNIKLK